MAVLQSPLLAGNDGDYLVDWDGTQVETRGHSVVYVEVTSYSGSPITIKGGILGANALSVIDLSTMVFAATIASNGYFQVPACGRMTATGIGASKVNLLLKAA